FAYYYFFFFSSRRRHTRFKCDWSSDVCSSDLAGGGHSLALKSDHTVVAWGGNNGFGQTNVPANLTNVGAVAAGGNHSLALKSDRSEERRVGKEWRWLWAKGYWRRKERRNRDVH